MERLTSHCSAGVAADAAVGNAISRPTPTAVATAAETTAGNGVRRNEFMEPP
jgi:hypothetical protein